MGSNLSQKRKTKKRSRSRTQIHPQQDEISQQETTASSSHPETSPTATQSPVHGPVRNEIHAFAKAQQIQLNDSATVNIVGGDSTVVNNVTHYHALADDELDVIVKWLTKVTFRIIQIDTFSKRAPKTGIWLLRGSHFKLWITEGGILWGTGMPGAGKTVLASLVIDHLLQLSDTSKEIAVIYAYCRYTDPVSVKDILAAMLKQLLEDHPSIITFIKPLYETHKRRGTHPSQAELLELLRVISSSNIFTATFCILDGLDEAQNDAQIDIISALATLPVRFFITSRPLASLKDLVPKAVFIDIVVQDGDIVLLVEQKLASIPALRRLFNQKELKTEIVSKLLEKSSGMFLVASLQLEMLRDCLTVKDLRATLERLPAGVHDMYETTMDRIERQPNANIAKSILLWLLHGRRSLTMEELQCAIAACPETYQYDPERIVDEDSVLSLCCGLVTLDPESKLVRLVHYTAKDFLLPYISRYNDNPHHLLASVCAARLLQCNFHALESVPSRTIDSDLKTIPLLEYSHSNWPHHASQSHSLPPTVETFILLCRHYPLQQPVWYHGWDKLNSLHVAAAFDFPQLFLPLLVPSDIGSDINARTTLGATALMLACERGHLVAAKLLLDVDGVDVNAEDNDGGTALTKASSNGHIDIVNALTSLSEIEVNHKDSAGSTALLYAAGKGHLDVVKALLGVDGIDIEACDEDGWTALMRPSREGYTQVVRELVEVGGGNVNAADSYGDTALMAASLRGHAEVVKALLKGKAVDVNLVDEDGLTALGKAAKNGHGEIVRLLVLAGASQMQ